MNPAITCLCPTYGRFDDLQDAIACFLLQDYPGNRILRILNDSEVPLTLAASVPTSIVNGCFADIHLFNQSQRFETLGHKRQTLLEAAAAPLVAHWDDDDLYLPWHLKNSVGRLLTSPTCSCVKHRTVWWGVGQKPHYELRGPTNGGHPLEGQMVFIAKRAIELGGYSRTDSGQAWHLLKQFMNRGELGWVENAGPSYIYRWGSRRHISSLKTSSEFAALNCDFGEGRPLLPESVCLETWACKRLAPQFLNLVSRNPNLLSSGERSRLDDCISAGA